MELDSPSGLNDSGIALLVYIHRVDQFKQQQLTKHCTRHSGARTDV